MNDKSAAPEASVGNQQMMRFKRAMDGHEKYIREAKRFDDFYTGQQWSEEDLQLLKEENRPALTINNILPTVNIALGEQVSRRADIRFKPKRRGASDELAKILSRLSSHVLDDNYFSKEVEPMVYSDGLIQDRGYYDVRIDFDENIDGEIKIIAEDPVAVIPDPEAKNANPKTWNEVWITRWLTMEEVEQTYGEKKASQIRSRIGDDESAFDREFLDLRENRFSDHEQYTPGINDIDGGKYTIRGVRVVERQYKKLDNVRYFIDLITGRKLRVPEDMGDDEAQAFADEEESGVKLIRNREKRIRWTVTALDVLLHDDWSIYRSFTIIPYFPYFRRGRPFGMVRNLIGPQEFLNKTRSQELHIVNTTANSGWIVEEGSLANMTTDELAEKGAKTGLVLSVHPNTTTAPQKIKPNPVPSGLDRISQKGEMDIRSISGISEAMLGREPASVSGVALEQKQARGQVQLQVPFSSLELTRRYLGEKILELVQDFYTEERVFNITNYSDPDQTQEEVAINQQVAGQLVNDVTVGEYDVIATSSPARDTFDEMQFAEMLSMVQAGMPIPMYMIAKYSHLEDKDEIVKLLKQIEGYTEPTPEEQEMAAMQQQLVMANAQLSLQEKQSKIAEIQSKSMLNVAKAGDLTDTGMHKDMIKHQQKLQLQREGLEARMRMSAMGHQASMAKQGASAQERLTSDSMKIANENRLAKFDTQSRLVERLMELSQNNNNPPPNSNQE